MSMYPYGYTTTTSVQNEAVGSVAEDILPGDIVAVQHGNYGRTEGLVVGSHIDYAGRKVVEVQLDTAEVYHAWYPTVTRVRRTVSYSHPQPVKYRKVERRILW